MKLDAIFFQREQDKGMVSCTDKKYVSYEGNSWRQIDKLSAAMPIELYSSGSPSSFNIIERKKLCATFFFITSSQKRKHVTSRSVLAELRIE